QNYPNPFNPSTTIRFAVPVQTHVELSIYNILGRHVATLVNTVLSAAEYEVEWSGVDEHGGPVASGVYFYRIAGDTFSETKKMVLLK
ncbi:MAG: T9SS type A sorting domain-containing protein, partial [candidate division Zixibacteria bacterium]|nr:T9SS type A sorting domain-containing protein [candidate division Zixibacteria bacterium]